MAFYTRQLKMLLDTPHKSLVLLIKFGNYVSKEARFFAFLQCYKKPAGIRCLVWSLPNCLKVSSAIFVKHDCGEVFLFFMKHDLHLFMCESWLSVWAPVAQTQGSNCCEIWDLYCCWLNLKLGRVATPSTDQVHTNIDQFHRILQILSKLPSAKP